MTILLSEIQPDFEELVRQFNSKIISGEAQQAWTDMLTAGTGQTLIEFISAVGAYDQLSIQRAFQENTLDNARIPSSIKWITRMLGVHITRRTPAEVITNLYRPTDSVTIASVLQIPPYSKFYVNNTPFFNRETIIFHVGQTSAPNFPLYQGEVVNETYTSDGQPFQLYEVGTDDQTLSDVDLVVYADVNPVTVTRSGLWNFTPTDFVCYENTLPNGNIEIRFGNGTYGKMPAYGTQMYFTYVRTLGEEANLPQSNLSISSSDFNINGFTITSIRNGYSQKSHLFYKYMAPALSASKGQAVRKQDFRALAMEYPGVIDAVILGQRDTHPDRSSWMNAVTCTLLTVTYFSESEWTAFVNYMKQLSYFTLHFVRVDPTYVTVAINAKMYVEEGSDLATLQREGELALRNFFVKRVGSLGFHLYLSDIYNLLLSVDKKVKYVEISLPQYDMTISQQQYFELDTENSTLLIDYADRPTQIDTGF